MKKIKHIALILFIGLVNIIVAQDTHYSQFYSRPLYINPALAGYSDCILRAGLDYRNQWSTITVPFTTESAFVDARWQPKFMKGDWFGIGADVYNDMAGTSNMRTTKGMLALAYHKGMSKGDDLMANIGVSVGFVNRSVSVSSLTFDSQWTGSAFDASLPSYNPYSNLNKIYFDINAGVLMTYKKWLVGFSLNHINKPSNSFIGTLTSRMGWKSIIHAETGFQLTRDFYATPKIYVSIQKMTPEFIFGSNFSYEIGDAALYLGIWNRTVYDLIPTAGLGYKKFVLLFSYDVNYSKLVPATGLQGGFEISLVGTFLCKDKKMKGRKANAHCPAYE